MPFGSAEYPSVSTVTDLTGALKIRRRSLLRKRAKRFTVLVAVLVAAIVVFCVVWFSPVLAAKQVRVSGTEITTEEQIIAAAQVPLGLPLVRTNLDEIADRILQIRAVKKVSVSRSWPSTVGVEVSERVRVYQWEDSGSYQWVDEDGVAFHSTSERVDGVVAHAAVSDKRLLKDIAVVVTALPKDLSSHIIDIVASSPDQIILRLDQGKQVIWGSAEQSNLKAQVLGQVIEMKATIFDVSSPGNPAVR